MSMKSIKENEARFIGYCKKQMWEIYAQERQAIIDACRRPQDAYYRAKNILDGRFYQGEQIIATSAQWAAMYAIDIIKGAFPIAEPEIAKNAKWAYKYAKEALKDRFPLFEKLMHNNKDCYFTALYKKRFKIN